MEELFFVLVKAPDSGWSVAAGPLAGPPAADVAREYLETNLRLRVVIAEARRSFTSRAEVVEDARPVVKA